MRRGQCLVHRISISVTLSKKEIESDMICEASTLPSPSLSARHLAHAKTDLPRPPDQRGNLRMRREHRVAAGRVFCKVAYSLE